MTNQTALFSKKTNSLTSPLSKLFLLITLAFSLSNKAIAGENIETEIVGIGGLCLDLPFNNTRPGTDLWMWGCNNSNAQRWTLKTNGEITVRGKCLDVEGPSTRNGANAQIWDCVNVLQQKFWVTIAGQIKSRYSNKCLTVKNGGTSFRTRLEFQPCDRRSEQRFAFPQAPTQRKWCGGAWSNAVTWDFSSRKGMVMRVEPTKKARTLFVGGWSNVRNCIPTKYRNSLWTFDAARAGAGSLKDQLDCHGTYAKIPQLGGPTWDLESYSNLAWHQWERTTCNGTKLR